MREETKTETGKRVWDEISLTDTETTENWFSRGKAEADKGIPKNDRIAGIGFFFAGSVLMFLYLVFHQIWSTGFFTTKFGPIEMIMLYGSWISLSISSGLEGILGKRLLSRLFDTFGGIIYIAVATAWLIVVFPFDFTYFANVLPDSLRFLVQWISNDIARVLMVLYAIVMGIAAIYSPIAYKFIRIKRSSPA
ncbi:MAG: hypothetical protein P8X84_06790 [Candidatus Bathyarchaeota archaeon]